MLKFKQKITEYSNGYLLFDDENGIFINALDNE